MSLNRHSSSRRKLNKSQQRRKSSQSSVNYQALEDRRLLAIDVGINVTSGTFGRGVGAPNQAGAVGPNHVVEVTDTSFKIYDKATGAELVSKSLDAFWTDGGGAGAESSAQMVANTSNARVLYDADTRRWYISAVSSIDVITGLDGNQSPTLVAVSRTANPTQDWQSLSNTYDVDDDGTPEATFQGGFLSAGAGAISTKLSVDDHNLYVTVGEADPMVPAQTWAFNKFSDLVVPNPTSSNASSSSVSSADLHWGSDFAGTATGTFGLIIPTDGSELTLTEITSPEIAGGAVFEADVTIAVDAYEAPPISIRQESSPIIINPGGGLLTGTKRLGDSLWAVHTILGSSDGQNPDGGAVETSALRWYEIDLPTKTVKQSGTIEHEFYNYIMPSIAVTQAGHVAISYTATGVAPEGEVGLFPTLNVSVGYTSNGITVMDEPVHLKLGEGGYFDGIGNFWGSHGDTIADPSDPTKIWAFGQWSDATDDGQTQIVEVELIGLSPELEGTIDDNVIIVRRSATDMTQVEVEIDGTVVASYEEIVMHAITVDGMGGNDTFILDTTNGDLDFPGGVNFIGDGDDSLELESILDTTWTFNGDGVGDALVGGLSILNFAGMDSVAGSRSIDTATFIASETALTFDGREAADSLIVDSDGTGTLTLMGGDDVDAFSVLKSTGSVVLMGQAGDDTFSINDAGAGLVEVMGGADNDTIEVIDAGDGTLLTVSGDDGEDIVNINTTVDSIAPILALGGNGNDEFNVINLGATQLDLMGETDDDTYTISIVDPTAILTIIDSVDDENDRLLVTGTDLDDVFDISGAEAIFNGGLAWSVTGVERNGYDGLMGNDQFNVETADDFTGMIELLGREGNDVFVVNNDGMGGVTIDGGEDDDTYTVFFKPSTNVVIDDTGIEDPEILGADRFLGVGTEFVDQLDLAFDQGVVNGGTATMAGIESVQYDALGEADVFEIASTIGDATFNGGDGDDVFNIFDASGVSSYFGESGMDWFNVSNHLDPVDPDLGESINIDGGLNQNRLVVNGYETRMNMGVVTDTQITGMSSLPINYVAAGSFSVTDGVGGIQLMGSDTMADTFRVSTLLAKNSLAIQAGGGDDFMTVALTTLGAVSADGQEGSDTYRFSVGSQNNRFLFAMDTGTVGTDRILVSLSENDDTLNLSGESFTVQTDNFGFNENFESLIVNAKGGNDTIDINRLSVNFLRVIAGDGDDDINVNNFSGVDSILIQGDNGDDNVMVNAGRVTGFLTAYGGNGDDSFLISQRTYGSAIIDGQEGSDRYDVFFADRSQRMIVARDSGTTGSDHLSVYGTVLDDTMTFRSGVVRTAHQDVLFTQSTETMSLLTGGSNDKVTVYGLSSPITNIMGESGRDNIEVISSFGPAVSKTINANGGSGDDYVIVRGTGADTTTNVFGDIGNDNLVVGSLLGENNGNLDNIRGSVYVSGGIGSDRLYINDAGKTASFNYDVTPTYVRNGGTASTFFGGITYESNIEVLRLDATNFKNEVKVTPSLDTAFSLFGNNGFNSVSLTDDATDGRQFFGQNGGVGFWTFTNGAKDVFFTNFLLG